MSQVGCESGHETAHGPEERKYDSRCWDEGGNSETETVTGVVVVVVVTAAVVSV
jgi:hypothetical protein